MINNTELIFIEGKTFNNNVFTKDPLTKGEYEKCTFVNCDFSGSSLSNVLFTECEFIGCNLSLAILAKTGFRDVKFKDSKMLGLRFEDCNDFGLSFMVENCNLSHCSFFRTKLKKTVFKNSRLNESDFTESNLTGTIMDNCDLIKATFANTVLEKADFRTSFNYSIDPEINRIKKARFSLSGITGLLEKYDIEIDYTN